MTIGGVDEMKVTILGGGAMGTAFAVAALSGGAEVTILDPSTPLVDAINADGVELTEPDGARRAYAMRAITAPGRGGGARHAYAMRTTTALGGSDGRAAGPADIAIVAVKSQHTVGAVELAGPLIGRQTTVVTLQNGWGNAQKLRAARPDSPLVVGVAYSSATVRGVGRVHVTNRAPTVVGPDQARDRDAAERVAALLTAGGMETRVDDRVTTAIWNKLVLNAAVLAPSALARLKMGDVGRSEHLRPLITAITEEAVAVGQAAGLDIALDERLEQIYAILEGAGDGKTSMLQDVEAERQTEIDAINGAVAEVGREHNIATPANAMMVALITALQSGFPR